MKLSIQLHALECLTETVAVLESFGIKRARSTVHNWVQKASLQPVDAKQPNHVALDEAVIQLNDKYYWLYAVLRAASRSDGL